MSAEKRFKFIGGGLIRNVTYNLEEDIKNSTDIKVIQEYLKENKDKIIEYINFYNYEKKYNK